VHPGNRGASQVLGEQVAHPQRCSSFMVEHVLFRKREWSFSFGLMSFSFFLASVSFPDTINLIPEMPRGAFRDLHPDHADNASNFFSLGLRAFSRHGDTRSARGKGQALL
jgi:hypothetical protein